MKIHRVSFALSIFTFVVLALGATMYAEASRPTHQSESALALATPTLGPTVAACPNKPNAPTLLAPTDGKTISRTHAYLDWTNVRCTASYYVKVRQGSQFGTTVDEKGVYASNYSTIALAPGGKYYWHVAACNARGCTGSAWFSFRVPR